MYLLVVIAICGSLLGWVLVSRSRPQGLIGATLSACPRAKRTALASLAIAVCCLVLLLVESAMIELVSMIFDYSPGLTGLMSMDEVDRMRLRHLQTWLVVYSLLLVSGTACVAAIIYLWSRVRGARALQDHGRHIGNPNAVHTVQAHR